MEEKVNEIPLGDGQSLTHARRVRSSVLARFKESCPETMAFINGLISEGSKADGDIIVKTTQGVLEGAIKGFPSDEITKTCAFLTEITEDVHGFGERYNWREMSDEQKVDFFDFELSDLIRLTYLITTYAKYLR